MTTPTVKTQNKRGLFRMVRVDYEDYEDFPVGDGIDDNAV